MEYNNSTEKERKKVRFRDDVDIFIIPSECNKELSLDEKICSALFPIMIITIIASTFFLIKNLIT